MKKKFNLEKKVEETLRALDDVEQLPHNPYFYTKLQQRLAKEGKEKTSFNWLNLWQPAFFAVLIAINIITFSTFQGEQHSEDGLSILKNEYQISDGAKKGTPLF